jgi:outer membrane immunogenic protein
MMRIVLAALAAILALAQPSLAADLARPVYKAPRMSPYYVAPFSWTGAYIGINGGYGWGKSNYDFGGGVTTGDFTVKGALVGGTAGYNLQTGTWVWGLEADLDASWIKGSDTATCIAPGCETKNLWLGTGRGRIGFAFDRAMVYGTGGAALGSLKFSPATNPSETKTKLGWTAGAGVEYAFMGSWSAKVEYLYVDLGNTTCSAASCGVESQVKFKSNIVRAGLNYRF